MNRSSSGLNLVKCIDGFNKYKTAEGLSYRSVDSYNRALQKWVEYQGDVPISQISADDIRSYLAWLRTEYTPVRLNGKTHPLSPKTLRNIHITFQAFFGWVCQEFKLPNPMQDIPAPRYKKAPVESFTREEVELLIKACLYCREAQTEFRRSFAMKRATANRDQMIIMILLDTGLRASEFCKLKVEDVDLKTGRAVIKHGFEGGAKGGKGRTVFLGKATRKNSLALPGWTRRWRGTRCTSGCEPRKPAFHTRQPAPFDYPSWEKSRRQSVSS